jgi:hypothetical protein
VDVSRNELLTLIGAKEVEVVTLRAQLAAAREESARHKRAAEAADAELTRLREKKCEPGAEPAATTG